jgi:hypothetical protein
MIFVKRQVSIAIEDLKEQMAIRNEKQQIKKEKRDALEKELEYLDASIEIATNDCQKTRTFLLEKLELSQQEIDKIGTEICVPPITTDSAEITQIIRRACDTKRY